MRLENIKLINFKSYEDFSADFSPGINCISGKNGAGKSNLLEAVHYLCLTKGAFQSQDNLNIKDDQAFFSVIGQFDRKNKSQKLICSLKKGERKQFKIDGKPYDKMSDHIGQFPCVLIAPDDTDLIKGGSEYRRKFFDSLISQINHEYLEILISYTQLLKQRNHLLKSALETGKLEKALLNVYNEQMIPLGQQLFEIRREFMNDFKIQLSDHYALISGKAESISLFYESDLLEGKFEELLQNSFYRDKASGRTNVGIHKDDFNFVLADKPLKKFGSQGQQKSYLIALKLAQYEMIKLNKSLKPLLLLDDIFDKLDDERIENLLNLIKKEKFGQIFITDARPERSEALIKSVTDEYTFMTLPS